MPRAGHAHRIRIPHRVVDERISRRKAVLILHAVGSPDVLVVRERVGLDELRRVGRVPRPLEMLPLPLRREEHLEVVRHVLRQRRLQRLVAGGAPGVVRQPVEQSLIRIDSAESSERPERRVGIEAVDVHLRVLIVVHLDDDAGVERDLTGELPAVAERPFVEVRLVQIRIELQVRDARRHRRRHDHRLEHAVRIEIVFVAQPLRVVAAEGRHRIARAHQLLMVFAVRAAQHVLGVGCQHVRESEARCEFGARLPLQVPQHVEAPHQIDAQPGRRRHPSRAPAVLRVEADVLVASVRLIEVQVADDVLPVEGHRARRGVGRVHHPALLEDEAVVQVLDVLVVDAPRHREDAGLELVRSAPSLLVVGRIAAQHRYRRSIEVEARVARRRGPLPAAQQQSRSLKHALVHERFAVDLDERSLFVGRVAVEVVAALRVVADVERRRQMLSP